MTERIPPGSFKQTNIHSQRVKIMNALKSFLKPGLLFTLALAVSLPVPADEVLWKSGKNLYIKLTEQDETASGERPQPNDHPVELDRNQVTNALSLMRIWNEDYIRTNEAETVFSTQQARLLGEYIAAGLREAGPDEDIVFALVKKHRGFLAIETREYMAGRVFYVDGRLNVIIGDYAKPADRFKERMVQSHGGGDEVQYYFTHGKRAKSSGFDERVINMDGIKTRQGRSDWYRIDVERASRTYLAEQREQNRDEKGDADTTAAAEAYQREAARLAKERREMRLEMARMRKQLEEARKSDNLSIEERLQRLDELQNRDLISEEEYRQKRQSILDEL